MTGGWSPETLGDVLLVGAWLGLACYRWGRRHARQEVTRLIRRQQDLARLLRPIADGMRAGAQEIEMRRADLVEIALLVEHPGADGEALAGLERAFGQPEPGDSS